MSPYLRLNVRSDVTDVENMKTLVISLITSLRVVFEISDQLVGLMFSRTLPSVELLLKLLQLMKTFGHLITFSIVSNLRFICFASFFGQIKKSNANSRFSFTESPLMILRFISRSVKSLTQGCDGNALAIRHTIN